MNSITLTEYQPIYKYYVALTSAKRCQRHDVIIIPSERRKGCNYELHEQK